VPAGPPIFCYPLLTDWRCAQAYAHPFPLSSHSPSMVSLRRADNARTNCAQGAILVTDLINIHEVSPAHAKFAERY